MSRAVSTSPEDRTCFQTGFGLARNLWLCCVFSDRPLGFSPYVSPRAHLQSSYTGLVIPFAFPPPLEQVRSVVMPTTDETASFGSFVFFSLLAFARTLESCSCSFLTLAFLLCFCLCAPLSGEVSLVSAVKTLCHLVTFGIELLPLSLPRSSSGSRPVSSCSSLFLMMVIKAAPNLHIAGTTVDHSAVRELQHHLQQLLQATLVVCHRVLPSHWIHGTHQNALLVQAREGSVPTLERYQHFNYPKLLVYLGHHGHRLAQGGRWLADPPAELRQDDALFRCQGRLEPHPKFSCKTGSHLRHELLQALFCCQFLQRSVQLACRSSPPRLRTARPLQLSSSQ